jgi:hypothetical protein
MARGRVAKPAASRSTSRNASSNAAKASDAAKADESALLDLGPLEEGVLVCRPSSRNRSPYVGDVRLVSGPNEGTTCVTHLPNLDSGGKCRPGVRLLCRRQPGVGPDTVGKFGTPKCELVCQLLRCEEPENAPGGVWVSAHPAIGEKLTQALMQRGAFDDRLFMRVGKSPAKKKENVVDDGSPFDQPPVSVSPVSSQVCRRREVSESASGSFRPDFSVEHPDGSVTVVETKQVVDTDYDAATAARAAALQPGHPVYAMRTRRTSRAMKRSRKSARTKARTETQKTQKQKQKPRRIKRWLRLRTSGAASSPGEGAGRRARTASRWFRRAPSTTCASSPRSRAATSETLVRRAFRISLPASPRARR